jgi:hypothetical protein
MSEEIGKKATRYFVKNVIGDGACGFMCIVLHTTHKEKEFKRIRKDINKFIIHHWELLGLETFYGDFKSGIEFNVGMQNETFYSKMFPGQ